MHTIELTLFFAANHPDLMALAAWAIMAYHPAIQANFRRVEDYHHRQFGQVLLILIDCLKLVGKVNIEPPDLPTIKAEVNAFLSSVRLSVDDFQVSRIDFCYNNADLPEDERTLVMRLLEKAFPEADYMRRYESYPTSVYYKSRSRVVQVYDKMAECRDKREAPDPHEIGVLRLEVQLKRQHLKYLCKQPGMTRSWDNCVDWNLRTIYLSRALEHNVFPGDYYTVERACEQLTRSGVKPFMVDRLREFLVKVSRCRNMDSLTRFFSPNTIRSYSKILAQAGVNPIPIPKRAGRSYLENLFRKGVA